ncbi:murein hydrolase activator EnvC family protein [Desulfovibrio inopinatus]|uniref:murein hydrolase activator EnvC family protein n=1 Tax=Desulfovibrio inopinatus TaxID=102109 RepID=UPI0003F8A83F|nr:peptidoglycan DD-metalloendopeptidase family protein [Desulfovibrio inopinatus]
MRHIALLSLALILFMSVTAWPVYCQTSSAEKKLVQKKRQADKTKASIKALTQKERELHKELADLEDRMKQLADDVDNREKRLASISAKEAELAKEYGTLTSYRDKAQNRVQRIMATLWPLHLQSLSSRSLDVSSWDEADRRFTWLKSIYNDAGEALADYKIKASQAAENLAAQEALKADIEAQFSRVNAVKDTLLQNRLSFQKKLDAVRKQKKSEEESLQHVIAAIESLNYKLRPKPESSKAFPKAKGGLGWPASGLIVSSYAPKANPPRRGIGMKLPTGTRIRAVGPGKVAHNDVLRGLGRVVIINHGGDYYSIYAFLSESSKQVGDTVATGDTVGIAGYYPEAKGEGLYFELRFRQNAINPKAWLAAK